MLAKKISQVLSKIDEIRGIVESSLDLLRSETEKVLREGSQEEVDVVESVVEELFEYVTDVVDGLVQEVVTDFQRGKLPWLFCCLLRRELDSVIDRECESAHDLPFCPTVEEVARGVIEDEVELRKIHGDDGVDKVRKLIDNIRLRYSKVLDLYLKCIEQHPNIAKVPMCKTS